MSKNPVAASSQNDLIKKAFKVYNFINGQGGEIDLPELIKHPSPLSRLSEEEAMQWLLDYTELNDKDDVIEKPCFVVRRNEDRLTVRVCIKVRLCLIYEKNGVCKHDPNCLQFHVCKGFLEGSCADSNLCSRSHDLLDKGNLNKIQKYRLEHLSNSSARKVITKNLPFVCEEYVNQECTNPFCKNLHVCPRLVKTICEDKGEDCPLNLSHDLQSPHNKRIFKEFFVPVKYLLCNILVSQTTRLEVMEKEGKRKGKVNKLNNLDTDDDVKRGEFSKLGEFPQNIMPNVPENVSAKAPKNKQKRKNDGRSDETRIRNEELNIKPGLLPTPNFRENLQQRRNVHAEKRSSLPASMRGGRGRPVPLMGLPMNRQPGFAPESQFQESMQNMLFQQDPESDHRNRGGIGQRRGARGNNQLLRGGRKWKSMDHFHGQPPLGPSYVGQEDSNRGGRGARGGRGRGSWRGRGRGTVLNEREDAPEMESLATNSMKEDVSEPTKEASKRSRRPRFRKRKSRSNSANADNATNLEEEEDGEDVEELTDNLMEFQFEDDDVKQNLINLDDVGESADLVDLNFEPDSGLSQASEAQALWDIFSQDQLYSYNSLKDKDIDSTSNPDDSCQSNEPSDALVATERAVFNCIVKEFVGSVSFAEISNRADLFHPDFQDPEQWFKQYPRSFLRIYNPQGQLVEIKTFALRAKMCFKYCGNKGCNNKNCPFFHVCEEFIAKGRCDAGVSCKKNHGFSDNHNKHIAAKLFPKEHFDDQQLQVLIQSSTPQVCLDYNNGKCHLGKHCPRIHVCKNYGKKRCSKGTCHLTHNKGLLTPATKSILQRYKIKGPPEVNGYILAKTLLVCEEVPAAFEKPPAIKKEQKKKSESKEAQSSYYINSNLRSHICLKFLLNRCKKGPKCAEHHCLMPYQWIYMAGNKWLMLSDDENLNLERFFCKESFSDTIITLSLKSSPSSSTVESQQNESYFYNVDFNEMHIKPLDEEGPNFPLKRLTTESEVHIPDYPLATKWRWFWKEADGFTEYKPKQGSKDPSSATIERHFLEGHGTYDFHLEPYNYRIYFKEKPMVQKNLDPKYYTKRDVCRRPQYVSKQAFESMKRSTHKLPIEDSRELPDLWVRMAECQQFLLYQLKTSSKEFKEMEMKFLGSIGEKEVTINSIDRVQNPFMMEKYLRKKNHMQKLAGASNDQSIDERFLFHGTSYRNIRPICKQNFDWRLYGEVTGNIHGEGAYFARDSSLSDCYCPKDDDGLRYIFVAKVLVGSYTKGDKKYKRPPHKDDMDPHSDLHDSCVDNIDNPKIFVVFDVDQYYPAYLITYRRQEIEQSSTYFGTAVKRQAPARPSSSSYSYSGSSLPSQSYSYSSSGLPSNPYSPASPVAASQAPSNLASAMAKQMEDFTYSAAGKKSNQQNCLVM